MRRKDRLNELLRQLETPLDEAEIQVPATPFVSELSDSDEDAIEWDFPNARDNR